MNKHASLNRAFRLVWSELRNSWVPAAETARGRRKRSVRRAARLAPVLAALGLSLQAHAAGPAVPATPAANTLPTGGTVVAGAVTLAQGGSASAAVLNVDQTSRDAVINWNSFNVGSAAEVNFNQPGTSSATLNRVLDNNPSAIFGKINAPGQVFLTNPSGVYFGKSASVNVGGLTATTNSISTADFMSGKITLTRNGATGSVINEGKLEASLGGYIALLAPEVRNSGVIIARMGTVALAAGEAITLDLNGNHLTAITVQPSAVATLIQNKSAVIAPGGLIILSATAANSLEGGVVQNSGTLEATGLANQGGRIVLEGSTSVENSGTINANAGADGSPAGRIGITAPTIVNSGTISAAAPVPVAAAALPPAGGGTVSLSANSIAQTASGTIDVSGMDGGTVLLQAAQDITVAGTISAIAIDVPASPAAPATAPDRTVSTATAPDLLGGDVSLSAGGNLTLQGAHIDVSGDAGAGQILIQGGAPAPSQPPADPPEVALLGDTELRSSSRSGKGGNVTITGNQVELLDTSSIDASGATGGGDVFVGGGLHGQNPSIADAQQTLVGSGAMIDASATQAGNGGEVIIWSNEQTLFAGTITARGGEDSGSGGTLEVSSADSLSFLGGVNAGADHGTGGSLLLDPKNITVADSGTDSLSNETFATNPSTDSVIAPSAITAVTDTGTAVTLQANNDLTISSAINTSASGGTGGALSFQAGRSITVNASVISDNGNISFSANDPGAVSADRTAATVASFVNNSEIDAGTANVSITMNTFPDLSGGIDTGHVTARNLTVTQDGPTAGGAIDLGETDLTGNLSITASSDCDVTNTLGAIGQGGEVVVRGSATIDVGAGNVTIDGPNTDFNIIGLTAANVTLNDTNAVQFANTDLSGNLTETTNGPIASTGYVQVAGATSLTANNGGFGYADPYIQLTNSANHFGGGLTLSVPSIGASGTGGYAQITDSGAIIITSSSTATSLQVTAAGALTTDAVTAGTSLTISAGGAVSLGTTSVGTNLTVSAGGAMTDTGVLTVPEQTTLTAGSANDITLDDASNNFNTVQVVSGDNVTLVDQNAINFGSYYGYNGYTSHVYGDFSVTAGGNISQTAYNGGNYAAITVGGNSTFTANNASSQIDLLLGTNNPFNPGSGSANNFVGSVTLGANNANTGFSVIELRNVSSTASVLSGLTAVGTLADVYLTFDNAPAVTLPGMTVTGYLSVYAPSVANTASTPGNIISQTGPIVDGGYAAFEAGSSGDIVLDNASNSFNYFGFVQARNVTVTDAGAIALFADASGATYNMSATGNVSVTAGGNIRDVGNTTYIQSGTETLDAGTHDITLNAANELLNTVVITAADNVTLNPYQSVILGNVSASGTLSMTSRNGGTLTQVAATAVDSGSTTTFGSFNSGITLANAGNVLGPLAISNAGAVNIRENDAITQASAWSDTNSITLTTSNDQAITLNESGNDLGPLTLTQDNSGATSYGAVDVVDNGNGTVGLTQGSAWTLAGATTLNSGSYSIKLTNPNNILGPLQVLSTTGTTNGVASSVVIYAKNTATTDAIADAGGAGAWSTGADNVELVAYDATGTTKGGGNITLTNSANVLGDLYIKADNVTITENSSIVDGPVLTNWDGAGDGGWATTGAVSLVVANPAGKSIALSNLDNLIGPIALSTTGTAGTLNSVLITDDETLTQNGVWNVGTAPVTLDSRTYGIDLPNSGNVMGGINITTANGTPTSVVITEDAPITQGSAWVLTGVPVTLTAENGNTVTLTNASNILGNLTVSGGAVSITENGNITQPSTAGGAWNTTGTTTLDPTAGAIVLTNANNVLGPIAIGGTPSAVSISEGAAITQASAWVDGTTPFTLNSGAYDIELSQANNQLGALTLTGADAVVTENNTAGITQAAAWNIPGTTTLTAGAVNPIVLTANPANTFGTVSIVSASNADIAAASGIVFGDSTISAGGTLTVSAAGAITQSGAITAPSLQLIGTGDATLTDTSNNVSNLAAGFSGGDLSFTSSGDFAVAVIGGTSGITVGAHHVTLTSVNGTVTGLSNVNASSSSLTLTTGTGLSLPQMSIAGPQTYTASTVSGSGIVLTTNVTSTAAGAISFDSPVTLGADLTVQSTNSAISFTATLGGATHQLNVNAGTGLVSFAGAVSGLGQTTDASAALTLTSGGASFDSTVGANNGLAITGPVTFSDTVTLADGSAASVFTGLVTLGKAGGMDLSGYNGMSFDGGMVLQNGSATIDSNNSPLNFQNDGVTGAYGLTLDSGTAALTGLGLMQGSLTSLTVTALNPAIPAGGIAIAGAQSYTATNGSAITLDGNVTGTAAGAITFHSPVTVGASSTVTSSDSDIVFNGTVDGNKNLTVNAGTGSTAFDGAVGSIAPLGSGTGAALLLQGTGATTFDGTVQARSGMSAAGPVTFDDNVTLGNGDTGSTFNGLVTSGGASGNTLSGYDGLAFDGGLALVGGPVAVTSNGSTIAFGGAVTGTQNLTLNALAGGAGTVTGLDEIGFSSALTGLNVTAQTLSLPGTGLAVDGPMTFSAAGGITVNGAVGNSSAPATGPMSFQGPVTLASGAVAITTDNAPVSFAGTVNGAQALAIDAGTGTTTFSAAVGGSTPLTSLSINAAGPTQIVGGSIHTTGAQTYGDAVTLGANTTLTGTDIQFDGTVDGAYALAIVDSGTSTFDGVVGGTTALTSLAVQAAGGVDVNTTGISTSGAQSYTGNLSLGADATVTGTGITFGGSVDGPYALTANATSGLLSFDGAVGALTPLASVGASGNAIVAGDVTTSGAQAYTALGGVTLGGNLTSTGGNLTVTGPTTLGADATISTVAGNGNIVFSGSTSTINGDYSLILAAGSGNVVLGGVVGGNTPLAAVDISGYDLTLPDISTVNDANQTYTALDNITLNQSRTLDAPISFTADADGNGSGSFILLSGVSLTASNSALTIQAADINLEGNSTLASGTGVMTLIASDGRNIFVGGSTSPVAGQMTITGSELSRMSSSGGLDLKTTGSGWIDVDGITSAQSQNITGTLSLLASGSGDVSFITSPSAFNALTVNAAAGTINVGVNLTTNNAAIDLQTPVAISGASTINSQGGNISFDGTVAVANDLTLTTSNGTLSFGGAVGSNQVLTLNLGGGQVVGLGQLQNTLTGLTVNSSSDITLPALSIAGPQLYNTGAITITGDLGGVGLTFSNVVTVTPASGTNLTLNSGTGTLGFAHQASFGTTDMTLIGDAINFAAAVTGSGSLAMQPYTSSLDVAVGGSGTPIVGLNLTAADMAWLPVGTLSSLSIGSPSGTGTLDVAGALNAPGTALTLNGGGGITQSGGSLTSGALTLYAAGNAITLGNPDNAFGAVGIDGAPSGVTLTNAANITQLGSAAWDLGAAPLTLNAGTHDITLTNAGNTFGTLVLDGRNAQVTQAANTDIGASTLSGNLSVNSAGTIDVSGALGVSGNVSLTASGEVTQSAPLTIGGSLDVVTTVNAGDVTLDNSGASATTIGNTQVGGSYLLTATGESITQAAGTAMQVYGDLTINGADIVLGGAGNLIGGTTTLNASDSVSTDVVAESGVITLGNRTETGNLTVVSEPTSLSFGGGTQVVGGDAVVLTNSGNNIGGSISVSASPPTIVTGGSDVQTGINQAVGTSISVAGVASFTAEASSAGTLGINLTNTGNSFGVLLLSGDTVAVTNSAAGLTTLGNTEASTSLALTAAGGVAQSGPIQTAALTVNAAGPVTLTNSANDVGTLDVVSGGNAISFVDSGNLSLAGVDAGGANVSLTAEGSGSLTQTGALLNVDALTVNAGAVDLTNTGNSIVTLAASAAGTGLQIYDSSAVDVSGAVSTTSGELSLRAAGDVTLDTGGSLAADAGGMVISTEGAGNFINGSAAAGSALVVGSGERWLVYSDTPDLVSGAHTVKGGLTSSFRLYDATYSSEPPGSVTQSGNGFIYDYATPTLSVTATIVGTPSQTYGSTPTATLGYTVTGFVDSEDNAGNVINGGTATYSAALNSTMDAGAYDILYTGGLTSNYNLQPAGTGVTYTVNQAPLTYTANSASRAYGAANPTLGGTISGFVLGQSASVLGGSAAWSTTAVGGTPTDPGSDVGQYPVEGGGYTSGNYYFVQAPGNATALTINPAALTVAANNDTQTYDGTSFSGAAGVTYSGFVDGQSQSALGGSLSYGGTAQGARNAGTYTITPQGLTSSDYTIAYQSGTLTINPADLTLTSSSVTRTYDGTLGAAGTAVVTAGTQLFGADSLSGGTFAFTNANAGSGDKTVSVSAVTVNDGNGGGNYDVTYAPNTTSTINPASITVEAQNLTKTYDGTLAATGTPTVTSGTVFTNVSNANTPDSVSGGSFAFTDANAGAGDKIVTVNGVTVNDGNGGGNYDVTYATNTTSTINPATLTYSATIAGKSYDGTTAATVAGYTLSGLISDQTLDATAAGATFSDPNAGTSKTVTLSGITLADGTNGGLASNYVVNPTASSTGTINPKLLTVGATVANKVYNGTTDATVTSLNLSGFVGDQTVTGVYTGTASFADKDAGTAVPVTITGVNLLNGTNGGLASNYAVPTTATGAANISPATLQIAGVVTESKVYDGTTTADLNTTDAVLTGVIGSDDVQVGSITGTFASKNVGTNIAIGAGTVVLTGGAAADYTLVQPTGLSANITPRPLTVSAMGVNKVYDGTTAATVVVTDNAVAGDVLTLTSNAAFLDKDAGNSKYVGVSDIQISGTDAQDYTVNSATSTFANITPATLTVTASGMSKPYDGTTDATVALSDTPLPGDAVNVGYGSASFSSPNDGSNIPILVTGLYIAGGTDAGNYVLGNTSAATTAAITGGQAASPPPSQIELEGAASKAVRGTWTLSPLMPLPVAASAPVPPQPVLDLALPTDFGVISDGAAGAARGSGAVGCEAGADIGPGGTCRSRADAGDGVITVSLAQAATTQTPGLITVWVPDSIASAGETFDFPLPTPVAAAIAQSRARVSLASGARLPAWLRYNARTKSFVVSSMPAGAAPLKVLLSIGAQRWMILIGHK